MTAAKLYESGIKFYATKGTSDFLLKYGIDAEVLQWPLDKIEPNILTYLSEGKIDLVINIPKSTEKIELDNDYLIRRKAIDLNIPLITNLQFAKRLIKALKRYRTSDLLIKSWDEYQ